MDDVIASIKVYVLKINANILVDLEITDEYLDFLIEELVDRSLVYMNRDQLVAQYEEDLIDFPVNESVNDEFWADYDAYPIPPRLEKVLARNVVNMTRTVVNNSTAVNGREVSVEDNGQKVTYSDRLLNYFNTNDESEIFSGSLGLMKKYMLGTIVRDEYI